jgi:hypothetical protein
MKERLRESVRGLLEKNGDAIPSVVAVKLQRFLDAPADAPPPLTAEESGYMVSPEDYDYHYGHSCYNCALYDGHGCILVDTDIAKRGSCNAWSEDGHLDVTFLGGTQIRLSERRLSPSEAGYIPDIEDLSLRPPAGVKAIGCRDCAWFGGKGCYPVNRPTTQYGCCNLFDATSKDKNQRYTFLSGAQLAEKAGQPVSEGKIYVTPVH